jgi:ABC-type uncharacterized transport system auxiliary subunit
MSRMFAVLFALAAATFASGCALLGKSDPVVARYFTPLDDSAAAQATPARATTLKLHLGRIEALSHLREPLVVRNSAQEVSYRDGERWTERPEIYVRTELSQALFLQRGIIEVMSGRAITLDVELTAFEELEKPQDLVRVQLFYVLHDDHQALVQGSIVVDQQVSAASGDQHVLAAVAAYSTALRSLVNQLADKVTAKLNELPQAQ